MKCPRCLGCGQQANQAGRPAYTVWLNQPSTTPYAVKTLPPLTCDGCGGSGLSTEAARAASVRRRLGDSALCPVCLDEGWFHGPNPELPIQVVYCQSCMTLSGPDAARAHHTAVCGCSLPFEPNWRGP